MDTYFTRFQEAQVLVCKLSLPFVEQTDVDKANKIWLSITHANMHVQFSVKNILSLSSRPFLILSCKVCHTMPTQPLLVS